MMMSTDIIAIIHDCGSYQEEIITLKSEILFINRPLKLIRPRRERLMQSYLKNVVVVVRTG